MNDLLAPTSETSGEEKELGKNKRAREKEGEKNHMEGRRLPWAGQAR